MHRHAYSERCDFHVFTRSLARLFPNYRSSSSLTYICTSIGITRSVALLLNDVVIAYSYGRFIRPPLRATPPCLTHDVSIRGICPVVFFTEMCCVQYKRVR